ncbi:MAG: alpha-glucosidase/alpha-galactosidase [Candidatus Nanopelagicales bacterium]
MPKIVIIGAGSEQFGRGMVADLIAATALHGPDVEIALVDIDPGGLERMRRLGAAGLQATGGQLRFTATTDRREALPGADAVIIAVAVKRFELWEQQYRVPRALGVNHVLGENGGPGALFHTLCSLNLIMPIARDIEELAPAATVLNFTNPEARVLYALTNLTSLRTIGLCHGVLWIKWLLKDIMGVPEEHQEVTSAGMNHAYVVSKAIDKRTGEDLLPELKRLVLANDPATPHIDMIQPLFREFVRIFDVISFNSDDHLGEYVSYGAEFHGAFWPYGLESRRVTDQSPTAGLDGSGDAVSRFLAGDASAQADALRGSGELAIPILTALAGQGPTRADAVNVRNDGGFIPNLPRHVAVEVPAFVDADGVRPITVEPLPETFAAILRTQYTIHELITQAWQSRERRLLLQALLLDPLITSIRQAEALLERMLELQGEYVGEFH